MTLLFTGYAMFTKKELSPLWAPAINKCVETSIEIP